MDNKVQFDHFDHLYLAGWDWHANVLTGGGNLSASIKILHRKSNQVN